MSMPLTNDQFYFARLTFQLQIHKRHGQDYENFFSEIMRSAFSNFMQIKPQGSFGDRKNDGIIKPEGKYYQVYAPQNPRTKEQATIDKLVTDFAGLYTFWNDGIAAIREFNFVLNDKYQGAYPSLFTELSKIEAAYPTVKCNPFLAPHLEDVFFSLPEQKINSIIGLPPSAEEIELNVSILNDVINHLLHAEIIFSNETIPQNPDFYKKIFFNQLTEPVATLLKFGSYQIGELDAYFKLNSNFYKDQLKNIFNKLYREGLQKFQATPNNDLVFFYIVDNAYPSKAKVYQDAVLVLMAYFFAYCDIFEEPKIELFS